MFLNHNSRDIFCNKIGSFLDLEHIERAEQKNISDNHRRSRWQATMRIPGEKVPYQMFITNGGVIKNPEKIKRLVSDHIISVFSILVESDEKNNNLAKQPSCVYNEEQRLLTGISDLQVKSEGITIRELLIFYLKEKLQLKSLKEKLKRLPESKYITSDRLPIAQQNLQTEIQDLENKLARFEKAILQTLKIKIQRIRGGIS